MRFKNMVPPVRVGIVGCGGIAQVFHLPILAKNLAVSIEAVCDIDASKAAVVAAKHGIQKVYQDIEEMLRREKIDAVFVLTPNNMHLPMSLIALKYGAHLFVEKPVCRNLQEVNQLRAKAEEAERVVMVGMQNRFRTDTIALKHFLEDRELGDVLYVKAVWQQSHEQVYKQPWLFKKSVAGGGVMMDLGIQLMDLAWYLLGKPKPAKVLGRCVNLNQSLQVEDTCLAQINFENQVALSLEVSWNFPIPRDVFKLEVVGSNGIGSLQPISLRKFWRDKLVNITPQLENNRGNQFKKGYENEVNHFINYLTGKTDKLESGLEDAVTIHQIIDQIYQ
ncbi:MAG: Gfo/Idh/MocA family oxidoreductase [Calditrichia bacterium]